jgi:hypothetical protein
MEGISYRERVSKFNVSEVSKVGTSLLRRTSGKRSEANNGLDDQADF